jgi:hypothetical protein
MHSDASLYSARVLIRAGGKLCLIFLSSMALQWRFDVSYFDLREHTLTTGNGDF